MKRKNTIAIRAALQAASYHVSPLDGSGFAGVASEPLSHATLDFKGEHGAIRITTAPNLSALLPIDERFSDRYEITIRRLRKAPRRGK